MNNDRDRSYWRAIVLGLQVQDTAKAAELMRLAEMVGEGDPENPRYEFAIGLAHFRAQRYQEAIDLLQKSPWLPGNHSLEKNASKWAVLAMACCHLGRTEEARHWLRRCEMWSDLSHRQATLAFQGDNHAGRYQQSRPDACDPPRNTQEPASEVSTTKHHSPAGT